MRWDLIYSGWSTQQFATALQDKGVGIKKRRLDGHLRTAGGHNLTIRNLAHKL